MSGYIGNIPVPQATQTRESFTATASQTTFNTAGYTPNFLDVFLNGVHLLNGTDYTATNGSDVVLTTGAAASDVVEVISYSTFEVANETFTGTTTTDNLTVTGAFTSLGIDDNATSTAMTLDASGNLLVGTTSTTPAVSNDSDGIALQSNGTVQFSANATTTAIINRKATDGAILQFRKDGTTVGSIGSNVGSRLYIESGDVGLRLLPDQDDIRPSYNSGASRDAAIDLGDGLARFKDLYLSGGVYLGGTGAANLLDDYEEGTWTPVLVATGVSISSIQRAVYKKVGALVFLQAYIGGFSGTPNGNVFKIGGMPFASNVNGYAVCSLNAGAANATLTAPILRINSGTTEMIAIKNMDATVQDGELDGGHLIFSIVYDTDA